MKRMKILNSQGKEVILNEREARVADVNQRICNALGYEIDITTLTTIMKKITEQKFSKSLLLITFLFAWARVHGLRL